MQNTEVVLGILSAIGMIIFIGILSFWIFRNEIINWFSGLSKPSEKEVKKQSERMLAQMDRNVSARKTKARL